MVYTLPLSCSTARLSYCFPFSISSSCSKMSHFFLSTASRSFSTASLSFSTASRSCSMHTIADCSAAWSSDGCHYRRSWSSSPLGTSTWCVLVCGCTEDRDCTDDGCTVGSCTGGGGTERATSTLPHDTFLFFSYGCLAYESTSPAIPSHAVGTRTAMTLSSAGERTTVFSSFPPPVCFIAFWRSNSFCFTTLAQSCHLRLISSAVRRMFDTALILAAIARQQIFYSQYDSRYVGCHWLIKPATLIGRNASLWLRSHHKCFVAYAVCAH